MKRIVLGILVSMVAALTAVSALQPSSTSPKQRQARKSQLAHAGKQSSGPKENTVLTIALQGNTCKLMKPPETIKAGLGSRVSFLISGSCAAQDMISIGEFKPDDKPFETITPVPAKDWSVLRVHVKDNGADKNGLWKYKVLLNGKPMREAFPVSTGPLFDLFEATLHAQTDFDFYVCPQWPC